MALSWNEWIAAITVVCAFVLGHSPAPKFFDGLPRILAVGGLMIIATGWVLIDQGIISVFPMLLGIFMSGSAWSIWFGRRNAEDWIEKNVKK